MSLPPLISLCVWGCSLLVTDAGERGEEWTTSPKDLHLFGASFCFSVITFCSNLQISRQTKLIIPPSIHTLDWPVSQFLPPTSNRLREKIRAYKQICVSRRVFKSWNRELTNKLLVTYNCLTPRYKAPCGVYQGLRHLRVLFFFMEESFKDTNLTRNEGR